jgi:hypothetical protein
VFFLLEYSSLSAKKMTRYSSLESFCIATRVWFLDILWPLAKKGVEITTVVYFWYADHLYWAMLTTSAILLPGILEVKAMNVYEYRVF